MSDSIANGFFKCGSSTQNINILNGATQWVGQIGYPIYYEPKVGIGSNVTPTATLQVTGNVYVSNAVTTGYFYGDGRFLTNVGGATSSQWEGLKGDPIYYVPYVGIGSGDLPTANLSVTGNVYVSNSVTTTNVYAATAVTAGFFYGDGSGLTNVGGGGGQWTGTTGGPITYTPYVGIGSADLPTANLSVTGNVYVSNTVTTTNVYAATEVLTGTPDVTTLDVTGNVFVSNAVTADFFYGDGGGLTNTSQWTNAIGGITYAQNVGIGSSDPPTSALQVAGDAYVLGTVSAGGVTCTGTVSGLQASFNDITCNQNLYVTGTTDTNHLTANTVTVTATTAGDPSPVLVVNGNARVSDMLTSSNVNVSNTLEVTGAMISNVDSTVFLFDTFAIPYIVTNALAANTVTSNDTTTANLTVTNKLTVANLFVTGNVYITSTNTVTSNAITIDNTGTTTALIVRQKEPTIHTHNVAEFYDGTTPALIIDPEGNLAIHTTVSPNYALTLVDGASFDVLTIRGNPPRTSLDVTGNVYVSNAVTTTNVYAATAVTAGFFYGDGSGLTNVGGGGGQWSGTAGNPITYTAYVGIGSAATPTSNLQVTGNVYISNALTVPYAYISNIFTSNIVGFLGSQWTTGTGNVYYTDSVGVGTSIVGAKLTVDGNVYISNALTVANAYISNIYTSNIVGFVGSQWTGTTGGPITYTPQVGIGSAATPTSNLSVTGNVYASNAVTTVDVFASTVHTSNARVTGTLVSEYITVSNLSVTGNFYITATNTSTTNSFTIDNTGTTTALIVRQKEPTIHTHNVAEFYDATTPALIIDPEGNLAVHTTISPNYALTLVDGASFDVLTIRGNPPQKSLDVTGNIYVSNALIAANAYISNIYTSNIVGFVGSQWTGEAGEPITYTPQVGIGSATLPTANLQVTGNLYVTTTIQYGEDLVRRAPHLVPSATNSGVITAWVSGTCNAVAVQGSFWALDALPPLVSNIAIGPPGLDSYTGSVLLNNGRVLFVPSAVSSGIGLFNPATDQYSVVAPAGSTLTGGYSGGVLVPNGNVVFVSNTATAIGVYNPSTLTFSSATAHNCATPAFFGGTLGPNSNVIMVPSTGHSNIGEYSPVTGVYSNAAETGTLGGYAGAVLIPNGNVVCVPWNSGRIGQYDYVNRVFSNSVDVTGRFAGGVLAPNGTVVCVPSSLSNVVVFNPVTNAASNIIAASGFFGGVLMPTGNIVCIPSTNSNVGWIDPIRLTYSNIVPQSAFGTGAFRGGTLLPDGRVIFCPFVASNVAGIQSLTPAPVEFCRSPYFNKF